ncbi:J domain-containing protein [Oligoflexus tunisiensis]|uniref:J domain-containing protein n=1 Tax=Oligoflexus tunisiensis TaxID=708132 RepID=UPI00114CC88E|nr:J domain-containing protein [Oligoflexus tunisiensis]
MPAARPKKRHQKSSGNIIHPISTCRDLVLVDSQPLRTKVWKQYQAALKKFEKYTADLHQFKNTDTEQYRLWYEGEFSREIIQLHKSRSAVADLTDWMEQIEAYAEYHDISLATSLRVLSEAKEDGTLDDLWEEMVKEIEESENNSKGKKAKDEWQKFEEAFDEVFEEATEDFFQDHSDEGAAGRRGRSRDANTEQELRKLYHQLALRLHPDTNPDQSQEHRQLFHKMQEAYRDQDVEGLEEIWKKLEGKSEGPFSWKTAAISEILSRKNSLNQRSRDLGTELKYARSHPAWEFSKTVKNKSALSALKLKVRHVLKREQADVDTIWDELNAQLQAVERQARRTGQRKAKVKSKIP